MLFLCFHCLLGSDLIQTISNSLFNCKCPEAEKDLLDSNTDLIPGSKTSLLCFHCLLGSDLRQIISN